MYFSAGCVHSYQNASLVPRPLDPVSFFRLHSQKSEIRGGLAMRLPNSCV